MFYKYIIRPILFLMDAETAHNFTLAFLNIANKVPLINSVIFKCFNYTSPRLKQKLLGQYFRTPLGLAAGMDKYLKAPLVWPSFDFGLAELGSITYEPQGGNKRPRLWRVIKERGIIINSGLPNMGAIATADKLSKINKKYKRGVWVISLAKSNSIPLDQAALDYAKSFKLLEPYADIITINLSCPNVKEFAGLQKPQYLEPILQTITDINTNRKPIWIKIGNDLQTPELDQIIALVKKYKINGIVASNLSKDKSPYNLPDKLKNKPGGLSGKLIQEKANKIIAYLYKHSDNKFKIIGCGGIFDGQDAYDNIKAGASLLQLATGFIYGGPASIKKINKDLDKLLVKDNLKHISQAVGIEANQYNL